MADAHVPFQAVNTTLTNWPDGSAISSVGLSLTFFRFHPLRILPAGVNPFLGRNSMTRRMSALLHTKDKSAYKIILGCCLLYAAVSGIGGNCKGVFYTPVAESLQVSLSKLTFASTLGGIVSACCMVPCCNFFKTVSARVSLSVMGVCYGISQILMGYTDSLLWYYGCAIFQGVFSGFLIYYPIQHIIGNWFPKKGGTSLGFVLMSSGIIGMIINPLATNWIEKYGWRTSYQILGGIMLIVILPATLFLLQKEPERIRDESTDNSPVLRALPAKKQHSESSPDLPLLFLLLFCFDLCIAMTQHLPSFAISIGRTATFGASLVSVSMAGNLISKMALGTLNDCFGACVATIIGAFAITAGCFCITLGNDAVIILSAFLIGVILSMVALQIPLIFRKYCSADLYEKVFPVVCSVNLVVGAASQTMLSVGFNAFESYIPVFLLAAADMLLCMILIAIIEKNAERK